MVLGGKGGNLTQAQPNAPHGWLTCVCVCVEKSDIDRIQYGKIKITILASIHCPLFKINFSVNKLLQLPS